MESKIVLTKESSSSDFESYFRGVLELDKQQRKEYPVDKPASSFYNRDDCKQEVYYDGTSLRRAVDALMKRKPYLVW